MLFSESTTCASARNTIVLPRKGKKHSYASARNTTWPFARSTVVLPIREAQLCFPEKGKSTMCSFVRSTTILSENGKVQLCFLKKWKRIIVLSGFGSLFIFLVFVFLWVIFCRFSFLWFFYFCFWGFWFSIFREKIHGIDPEKESCHCTWINLTMVHKLSVPWYIK